MNEQTKSTVLFALEVIRDVCGDHKKCDSCPFSICHYYKVKDGDGVHDTSTRQCFFDVRRSIPEYWQIDMLRYKWEDEQ